MNILKKIETVAVDLFWNHPTKIVFALGFLTGVVFSVLFL